MTKQAAPRTLAQAEKRIKYLEDEIGYMNRRIKELLDANNRYIDQSIAAQNKARDAAKVANEKLAVIKQALQDVELPPNARDRMMFEQFGPWAPSGPFMRPRY